MAERPPPYLGGYEICNHFHAVTKYGVTVLDKPNQTNS